MVNKVFVIRVVQTKSHGPEGGVIADSFLECLRYIGYVDVHSVDPRGLTARCFDILPPNGISDTKRWAEMESERMRSFGFNAVVAPRAY